MIKSGGNITIPNVKPGAYVITETRAPSGYVLDKTPQTIQVGTDGKTYQVIFDNVPLASIVITKRDARTGTPLADAIFKVTDSSGAVIGSSSTWRTNSQGEVIVPDVPPGAYIVTEIQAPPSYAIDADPQTIVVGKDGKPYKVTFDDYPASTLNIVKVDAKTNQPLAGAQFKITRSDGSVVGTTNGIFATDATGNIVPSINDLGKDTYTVTEIKAPDGYSLSDISTQTIKVDYGQTYTLTFQNRKNSNVQFVKIDEHTGQPLIGAEIKLYKQSGELVGTYVTDADGVAIVDDVTLADGWYKAVESKAPNGYALDTTPQDFQLTGNQFIKLTFADKKLQGITIQKLDSATNLPLAGARFEVWIANDTGNTSVSSGTPAGSVVGTYTTDNNGLIQTEPLPDGVYTVKEVTPPTGYQIDNAVQQVTVSAANNKPTTVTFYDTKIMGLQIFKVDEADNRPLQGAEFKVTTVTGTLIGLYTTDSNGAIDITKDANGNPLPSGDYIVTETKAPQGYAINETPKTVTVVAGNKTSVTFKDQKLQGVVIQKVDSQTHAPLAGAQFEIWTTNGSSDTSVSASQPAGTLIGTYTTDTQGLVTIATLPNGTYVAKETKAPDGYRLDAPNQVFTVSAGQPTTITFADTKVYGVEIIKLDSQTKQPLSGAVFNIYDIGASGNTSVASGTPAGVLVGTYTTDINGLINVTLPDGEYEIVETQAPDGYQIDNAKQDVTVKAGQKTSVTFSDTKIMGLQIIKLDSQSKQPLQGAVFNINKTNSDASSLTAGSSPTGDLIGTYTTDVNGQININNLSSGEYTITEVTAPKGYQIDNAVQNVKIEAGRLASVTFTDTLMSGLQITKLNSETRQPIGGVVFSLSKMDGARIGDYTTDVNGVVFIPNLDDGWYTVVETKTADGYLLDATPHNIEVKKGQDATLEILNKPMSGLLITKTDAQTGKPLQGVVFDVRRADGQLVAGNILDANQPNTEANSPNKSASSNYSVMGSYVTDANGQILINDIPAGEYTVVETKQLPGYELDTSVHNITITPGKLVTMNLTNKPLAGLRLHKIDSITKQPIYNVEFMVFDSNGKVVGTFYTDNQGVIDFSAILTEGRYTIRETRAAPGYYRDDLPRTVEFIAGKVTDITWENVPEAGQIQIRKTSADDSELNGFDAGTPLQGAIFEVREYKSGNVVDKFITGSNGVGVSRPLPLGRYVITEIQAPEGV